MVKNKALVVFFFLSSCLILKDDTLYLEREQYTGFDIRLDGYWWKNLESNVPRIETYFFYQNGVVLYGMAIQISKIHATEEEFKSVNFAQFVRKSKTGWGVFQVNANEIEFETWEPSSGGGLKTSVRSGVILNDTTFVITNLFSNYTKKNYPKNDTFHFKKLTPKPDSTNRWVP